MTMPRILFASTAKYITYNPVAKPYVKRYKISEASRFPCMPKCIIKLSKPTFLRMYLYVVWGISSMEYLKQ